MNNRILFLLIILFPVLSSCGAQEIRIREIGDREFGKKWYQGKAEISSYELEQARYGEVYPGEAILIFVTEDFSLSKQVKLDNPGQHPDDAVKVMKLNAMRTFTTGLYEYQIMHSVFTPVDVSKHPATLKVTGSFQDWCGQSWIQYNLDENAYRANQFSYFESEGDQSFRIERHMLEDEIWTRIRTAPHTLPTGTFSMIPGINHTRLMHAAPSPENVSAQLERTPAGYTYSLEYNDIERKLVIRFEGQFPYAIEGWEETVKSGHGQSARILTTRATRKKQVMIDYWKRNAPSDRSLRTQLGLSPG